MFAEHSTQLIQAATHSEHSPPNIISLAFDFSTGTWVKVETAIMTPDVAEDAEGNTVVSPALSTGGAAEGALRVGVPQNVRRNYGRRVRTEIGLEPSPQIAAILDEGARKFQYIPKWFIYMMCDHESGFNPNSVVDTRGRVFPPGSGRKPEYSLGLFNININPGYPAGDYTRPILIRLGKIESNLFSLHDPAFNLEFWAKYIVKLVLDQARVRGRSGMDKWLAVVAGLAGFKFGATAVMSDPNRKYAVMVRRTVKLISKWTKKFGVTL
jgi:hypothetical protein